jgi:hypothetical protein
MVDTKMKRSPLKKMGKDKARETRKYWPLRRKYIEEHPFCEFPLSRPHPNFPPFMSTVSCIRRTAQIHHMRGQNWRVMNDTRYWMGLCAEHHQWITDHQTEARKRGLILIK